MQIVERDELLTVRDRPGCLWLFGLWFVAGGVLALLMPFVAVNRSELPWWGRLLTIGMGLATLCAGLFTIRSHPETTTELDAGRSVGRVTTRGFARAASTDSFPLADARSLEVVTGRDGDGDPTFRLRLWLAGSRSVWLQANPAYGGGTAAWEAAERVRAFLALRNRARRRGR